MKPAPVSKPTTDPMRIAGPGSRIPDFLKLLEEIKNVKHRLLTIDTARLDDEFAKQRDNILKGLDKKINPRNPDDLLRLQAESLRIVEADHDRSKEILNAKYQKLDSNLLALTQFLQTLAPVKELETKLAEKDERLKKQEDELTVQRKVMAHEQEEIERDRRLVEAGEDALKAKTHQVEAQLTRLDVVERAREIDRLKAEFDEKLKVFQQESADIPRRREEINRDLEMLGLQRAAVDREEERLNLERIQLERRKASMADTVARELAGAFETFVRDLLSAPPPAPPAKASVPAGKRKPPAADAGPDPAKAEPPPPAAPDPFRPPGV